MKIQGLLIISIALLFITGVYSQIELGNKDVVLGEKTTCNFIGSNKIEKCFIDDEENNLSCEGREYCQMTVHGLKSEQAVWKSSCGGYAYTTIDGNDETVSFYCFKGKLKQENIKFSGFRDMFVICQDDNEKSVGSIDCKSFNDLMMEAILFCSSACVDDNCGIKSVSVSESCYSKETDKKLSDDVIYNLNEKVKTKEIPLGKDVNICKDSCPYNDSCITQGEIKNKRYCSEKGSLIDQKKQGAPCNVNYECSSNICEKKLCKQLNILEKIYSWFISKFK